MTSSPGPHQLLLPLALADPRVQLCLHALRGVPDETLQRLTPEQVSSALALMVSLADLGDAARRLREEQRQDLVTLDTRNVKYPDLPQLPSAPGRQACVLALL